MVGTETQAAAQASAVRVRVKEGRQVYRGPGPHPFRSGEVLELPAEHAAALTASGHVEPEAPA